MIIALERRFYQGLYLGTPWTSLAEAESELVAAFESLA